MNDISNSEINGAAAGAAGAAADAAAGAAGALEAAAAGAAGTLEAAAAGAAVSAASAAGAGAAASAASYPKVTVVGAGNVGASTALLLLLKNLADVVLIDVAEGIARGKALDLMHMRCNEGFLPTVTGTGDYQDTAGSQIVVVTAGVPRKPGMTREDLLGVNSSIVRSVLDGVLPTSPEAILIFVTNPLDVMTNLAFDLASKSSVAIPPNRLIGMGGVLDTARFKYAIAQATGQEPSEIDALVIGAHGEAMVPLPSLARVNGKPLEDLLPAEEIEAIVDAAIGGGAAVVELLQTGSAFYAPASSIVRMVEEILRPSGTPVSACVRLNGEYGVSNIHMCVPAILGPSGVEKIVALDVSPEELSQLQVSASSIRLQTETMLAALP
jgi:malate dehydrogenase